MSKIALIGFHNLYLMQFLYKYTDILDENNIKYDVIYWDRDMDSTIKAKAFNGRKIIFRYKMSNYQAKHRKILGFVKCLRFMLETIRKNKYDRIILLTTQTVFPLYMLSRTVRKTPFIFDYRDITYEGNGLCKKIIRKIIEKSEFTAISSQGFKSILGDSSKFVVSHNTSNLKNEWSKKQTASNIRLVYWGMIRQLEFNKKICDAFGNALGFELVYHGEGKDSDLKEYCNQKGYSNVKFTGRYTVDQIPLFVSKTDILMNLYENDEQQKLAVTVKLYDGIRFGLPMLVSKNSYMEDIMKDNAHVFAMDIDSTDISEVEEWYRTLDKDKYPYDGELEKINLDEECFKLKLLDFARR